MYSFMLLYSYQHLNKWQQGFDDNSADPGCELYLLASLKAGKLTSLSIIGYGM
jgi:hypothetical protein